MNAMEMLVATRKLLTEKGWTQGNFAVDANGRNVSSYSDKAAGYCLVGAMRSLKEEHAELDARILIKKVIGNQMLSIFNDKYCKSVHDVLDVLDRAIELGNGLHV